MRPVDPLDDVERVLQDAGARAVRREGDVITARWRGAPVRRRVRTPDDATRIGTLIDALRDLPDPIPTAEIDLARHAGDDVEPLFVPHVPIDVGRRLLELAGDSFLVILDRATGAMTVLGHDASDAALAVEHRLPRAAVGHEHGLAQRTAEPWSDRSAGPADRAPPTRDDASGGSRPSSAAPSSTTDARAAKLARLRPWLRCVRCEERAELRDVPGALRCRACDEEYPIVDGVPILLPERDVDIEPAGAVSSNSYSRQSLALFDTLDEGLVLDCGCGRPAENLPHVVHLEIVRHPNVDVVASSERLPFADGTFRAALCESVLEHVPDPWAAVAELHRVLAPDGVLRVDAPFIAPFHGYPDHYHNFTQAGLERLLHAFEKVEGGIGPHQEPWIAIGWILRLVREGLPDDAQRAQLDASTVGALLAEIATGRPPSVLHPLDDATRRSLAAGFYFYGRRRET